MTCPTCNKPTPADSVHTCSPVPLLTAEMAALLRGHDPAHIAGCVEALEAIADGRAVVVPRMTEAEARERFHEWARGSFTEREMWCDPQGVYLHGGVQSKWGTWCAALRDIGVLRD